METPQFLTKLKVLRLRSRISSSTGELAQAILSSVPSLEEFTIDYITDVDILKGGGGPWVCSGLKKLKMAIVLLDTRAEEMVLERVGSLKNLTSLDLSMGYLSCRSLPDAFTGDNVMVYAMKLSLVTESNHLISQQMQQQPGEPMDSQSAFTPPSPLDIPELLQLITSYMHKHDVATCLRVSFNWYQAFLPALWSRLEINLSKYDPSGPPLPERDKYWSLVQKLILSCYGNFKMPCSTIKCRNLTHLEIHDTLYQHNWWGRTVLKNERSLAALIKRHRSSLRVFISNSDTSNNVLGAFSGCTQLAKLELHSQHFDSLQHWMKWYGPLWSRLESLTWNGNIQNVGISKKDQMDALEILSSKESTIIKYLDLKSSGYKGLTTDIIHTLLIAKSPELVRFSCDSIDGLGSRLVEISQKTPFGQCLQTLTLRSADMRRNDLKELSLLFPKLSRVECNDGIMDVESLKTYQRETPQLLTKFRVLGLKCGTSSSTGELAQAILSSVPSLEELTIDYITDVDILKGGSGPWVCTGLKKLKMAIVLLDERAEEMVLERVGSLENLTSLDLSMDFLISRSLPDAFTGDAMAHRTKLLLGTGLDKLRTLQRLEKFIAPSVSEFVTWTEAEASWALKHWTQLTELRGMVFDEQARKLLNPRLTARTVF
ncbi:hypothetical protein EMPS_07155 [Entomortierella parvispora]|uniref:F-box domain-containing protein n=1 Tax=Entomortierella parvispora TaxID=205924 RepID=A0A9P3LY57_9FUNG|nr:hypothetical protein EMPS_07155 [Entomortierella parvispora]